MNLLVVSPLWLVAILVVLLAAATIQDAIALRISNIVTAAVFVLAVVAMVLSGLRFSLWQNVLVFGIVLIVGTVLFSRRALGGGDVKLMAAIALWTNLSSAPAVIAAILICGGLVAVTILFLRTVVSERVSSRVVTLQPKAGIPYAIAISIGTLAVMGISRETSAATNNPRLIVPLPIHTDQPRQ